MRGLSDWGGWAVPGSLRPPCVTDAGHNSHSLEDKWRDYFTFILISNIFIWDNINYFIKWNSSVHYIIILKLCWHLACGHLTTNCDLWSFCLSLNDLFFWCCCLCSIVITHRLQCFSVGGDSFAFFFSFFLVEVTKKETWPLFFNFFLFSM